jgi:microcystin-dependent protein
MHRAGGSRQRAKTGRIYPAGHPVRAAGRRSQPGRRSAIRAGLEWPYVATYNNSDGAFYLQGFYGNPYNIPLGGMLDFIGTTAPNSAFVMPFGQAISRTTYAGLFALTGTTYGNGDGSTTFNVPDLRGRVLAGKDDMGGSAAGRITNGGSGITGTTLGAVGGGENETLTLAQLPGGITSAGSGTANVTGNFGGAIPITNSNVANWGIGSGSANGPGGSGTWSSGGSSLNSSGTASVNVTSNNTGGGAHPNMQPTIIGNKILRVT